ncbi:MAG: hypothetical protein OXG44_12710 [Gammaproteobacteria bacterium]|nr:hypothetical protein [Gammaproteobacteria bacterium]
MTRAASAALGDWNPKPATLNMIGMAAEHIDRLHAEGYTPTLRQIYYQMVRSNQIANSERSYKNLGNALNQARWAGMIDIYALDDLGREAVRQISWRDPTHALEWVSKIYRTDWWRDSDTRPEIWCEKQALSSVLDPVARRNGVYYLACKGFVSLPAIAQAAERAEGHRSFGGASLRVLYLGDHDPSGIVMNGDIERRVELLTDKIEIVRIAMTRDQVDEFDCPPQPAKLTDSRARDYVGRHGYESWELDAIQPSDLDALVQWWIDDMAPESVQQRRDQDEENFGMLEERIREMEDDWKTELE